jgi:D-arabinose 1-dehydrogenase-like Zn-dependent alcohol dehydrogenase
MTQMIRQSMTAYAAPLCETVIQAPKPKGTEVLLRVHRCGVCHSDVHLQDGYFSLGGDKKLDVTGPAHRTLPFTLGHEIAGLVEEAGPDADVKVGQSFAVFPWIGCGHAPHARQAKRTSVLRRVISASRSTADSRRMSWCRIQST